MFSTFFPYANIVKEAISYWKYTKYNYTSIIQPVSEAPKRLTRAPKKSSTVIRLEEPKCKKEDKVTSSSKVHKNNDLQINRLLVAKLIDIFVIILVYEYSNDTINIPSFTVLLIIIKWENVVLTRSCDHDLRWFLFYLLLPTWFLSICSFLP